jgi:hypothetical protein
VTEGKNRPVILPTPRNNFESRLSILRLPATFTVLIDATQQWAQWAARGEYGDPGQSENPPIWQHWTDGLRFVRGRTTLSSWKYLKFVKN